MATPNFPVVIHGVEQDILEPIAIIGFSLRYPQDATSPASFWELLKEKRCAMTELPKDRFNVDAFYHPEKDRRNTVLLFYILLLLVNLSNNQ